MRPCQLSILFVLAGFFGCQEVKGSDPVDQPQVQAEIDGQKDHPESGQTTWVCRVEKPGEEPQDLVTSLPPEELFIKGLIPEAIVGVLKTPLKKSEAIKPENFVRNKVFNDFMHEFIARGGPELKGLKAKAQQQGEGWVYLIDARTPTPQGQVPPQDIIGGFKVKAGLLVVGTYKRNPNHVLLSQDGFFRLPPELNERLKQEVTARNSKSPKPEANAQNKAKD